MLGPLIVVLLSISKKENLISFGVELSVAALVDHIREGFFSCYKIVEELGIITSLQLPKVWRIVVV